MGRICGIRAREGTLSPPVWHAAVTLPHALGLPTAHHQFWACVVGPISSAQLRRVTATLPRALGMCNGHRALPAHFTWPVPGVCGRCWHHQFSSAAKRNAYFMPRALSMSNGHRALLLAHCACSELRTHMVGTGAVSGSRCKKGFPLLH